MGAEACSWGCAFFAGRRLTLRRGIVNVIHATILMVINPSANALAH
jgi:hypothetical protein